MGKGLVELRKSSSQLGKGCSQLGGAISGLERLVGRAVGWLGWGCPPWKKKRRKWV